MEKSEIVYRNNESRKDATNLSWLQSEQRPV